MTTFWWPQPSATALEQYMQALEGEGRTLHDQITQAIQRKKVVDSQHRALQKLMEYSSFYDPENPGTAPQDADEVGWGEMGYNYEDPFPPPQ